MADPEILTKRYMEGGAAAEYNVLAPSWFKANAHNELYAFCICYLPW